MATLTRQTVQSLAVLRALSHWSKGAFGPLRVQKTLFFADQANDPEWRLLTFKRYYLGQYSPSIAEALNALKAAGRIRSFYDGPSERICSLLRPARRLWIARFFQAHFRKWDQAFRRAFHEWAYLSNDQVLFRANSDPSYKTSNHGETIFESALPELIEFEGLSEDDAEELSDLVDPTLHRALKSRMKKAVRQSVVKEDWRKLYFRSGDD